MSHQPDLALEEGLWARGYCYIAGLDEVGRGAWAGPVVAAAVILPHDQPSLIRDLAGVRDSKLLSPRQREDCYDRIVACASAYAVGSASAREIDQVGIVAATRVAMTRAVRALARPPDYLVIDALRITDLAVPQYAAPKADRLHLSVSAASIIAKVERDHWMVELDRQFPGYGLSRHKGYGTAAHLASLTMLGASAEHRMSFAPLRAMGATPHGARTDSAQNTPVGAPPLGQGGHV